MIKDGKGGLYDTCSKCGKLVKLNKFIFGDLHICVAPDKTKKKTSRGEFPRSITGSPSSGGAVGIPLPAHPNPAVSDKLIHSTTQVPSKEPILVNLMDQEYTVIWYIQVDGKDPREAAENARKIQLDPESTATSFIVGTGIINNISMEGMQTVDLMDDPED